MDLTDRERRVRAGELGEPLRAALEQQIAVGEFFGTERVALVRQGARCHPYWIRATQEDGAQAWTSPVYLNV